MLELAGAFGKTAYSRRVESDHRYRKDAMTAVSAPPALDDLMNDREVPPLARAVVLEAVRAVEERGMTVEARPSQGHISLLPTGKAVAVFVHPRRFSLTFDKAVAVDLAARYEVCELQNEASQKTGHVRIAYERLRDARWTPIVTDLLVEALERTVAKKSGAKPADRATAPAGLAVAKQCPVHQQAMFGGTCYLCD